MSEELFDICDDHDRVIGQAPRSTVHAENLRHRAVHIWVWNSAGELLVQKRTATKDQYPNCYTSSASGHVDAGEDYATAAHRELAEELQLSGNLTTIVKLPASAETAYEHTQLYCFTTDEEPIPDPNEIASLEFRNFADITKEVSENPEEFTPPFRMLVEWWFHRH